MLTRIAKGPYPKDKAALAYNMLCYLYKKRFSHEAVLENLICVLVFGDLASSYGPFTHCVCTLACFFAPLKDLEPYKTFESLWTSYDEYRERWGLMLPGQKCCAVCGTVPEKKRELKKCAGSCLILRKPLYCGKVCQKKVRVRFIFGSKRQCANRLFISLVALVDPQAMVQQGAYGHKLRYRE